MPIEVVQVRFESVTFFNVISGHALAFFFAYNFLRKRDRGTGMVESCSAYPNVSINIHINFFGHHFAEVKI